MRRSEPGVAYVPFFPLGGGFTPLQSSTLSEVAKSLEATPTQVALAWLLQRAPNILVIPSTSSLAHLRENLEAAKLRLPRTAVELLNTIGSRDPRWNAHLTVCSGSRAALRARAAHSSSSRNNATRSVPKTCLSGAKTPGLGGTGSFSAAR
jgi:hypothetical protein